MWIVTADKSQQPVAVLNPTRGKDQLAYQLKKLGLMEGAALVGAGPYRRVVKDGQVLFHLMQVPKLPKAVQDESVLLSNVSADGDDQDAPPVFDHSFAQS